MWPSVNHIERIGHKAAARKQSNKRFFASCVSFVVKMVGYIWNSCPRMTVNESRNESTNGRQRIAEQINEWPSTNRGTNQRMAVNESRNKSTNGVRLALSHFSRYNYPKFQSKIPIQNPAWFKLALHYADDRSDFCGILDPKWPFEDPKTSLRPISTPIQAVDQKIRPCAQNLM